MQMMHRRSVSVQDDMGLPRKVGLASMGDNLADDGSDLSL